jgi:phosphatidylserine/phosphatidylglycerophosphate/cardiolipin synthase-like enzyme
MRTIATICLSLTISAVNLLAADSDVVVTELSSTTVATNQWIEIYNRGTGTVDVASWKIQMGTVDYPITGSSTLLSGVSHAVIATDTNAFKAANPSVGSPILQAIFADLCPSVGRTITLKNSASTVIETFTALANSANPLERVNYDLADYSSSNWKSSSSSSGTPNQQNSRKFVRVYFTTPPAGNGSTEIGIVAAMTNLMNSATGTVFMAMYNLNINGVKDALLAAHNRGVDVRYVTEKDNLNSQTTALISGGISVIDDGTVGSGPLMHNKFIVVDGRYVWTGSFNTTTLMNTTNSPNNGLIVDSTDLSAAFASEFDQMFTNHKFSTAKTKQGTKSFTIAGTNVKVFFSPKDGGATNVVNFVQSASVNSFFDIFSFTRSDIANAFIANNSAGKTVQGYMGDNQGQFTTLTNAIGAANVKKSDYTGDMHHKFGVVDAGKSTSGAAKVETGSMNWSNNGNSDNDENLLIITSYDLANMYYLEFLKNFSN